MTEQQAREELAWLDNGVLASFKDAKCERHWYVASSPYEARQWINFHRDWMIPGSDEIEG